MIALVLCVVAFLGTLAAARASLGTGLAVTMAVGYAYGIVRANLLSAPAHMLFDASVLGLYLGCGAQVLKTVRANQDARRLVMWVTLLMAWPTFLAVLPGYDPLLQLVGWRGNAFLLPFLLIGAVLTETDLKRLAVVIAVLNLAVFGVALAEYFTEVARFFPENEVTRTIYASNDVAGYTALRIPATFANAHAYGGTMVITIPLLLGLIAGRGIQRTTWTLAALGLLVALLGVFLAAARTHALVLIAMTIVVTLFGRFGRTAFVAWAAGLILIGFVVGADARLQRFATLQDLTMVSDRVAGSVNVGVFDAVSGSPLGNGLSGGGTSVPYFLQARMSGVISVENEYGRIGIEQGTVGLLLWAGFIGWALLSLFRRLGSSWFASRLAAATVSAVFLSTAFIGTGLLTSVPQSSLMLLWTGWLLVPFRTGESAVAVERTSELQPAAFRRGWRTPHGAA